MTDRKMSVRKNILNRLQESDYIKQLHKDIKEGLIGNLRNEYILKRPLREPYEEYMEEIDTFVTLPIFHAIVDMMTANLLTRVQEKLIDLVVNQAHSLLKEKLLTEEELAEIVCPNNRGDTCLDHRNCEGRAKAIRAKQELKWEGK